MGTPALPAAGTPRQAQKGGKRRRTLTLGSRGGWGEEGGDPRTVLEHLEEREGGDVDLLGGVEQRRVRRRLPHPGGAEDPLQPLHRRFRRLASLCSRFGAWVRVRSIWSRLVRKSSGSLAVAAAALISFFDRTACARGWASFGVGWAGLNWRKKIRAALQIGPHICPATPGRSHGC